MATEIGTVQVPLLITISGGNPALEICSVVTDMTLSISGTPRPVGASSVTVDYDKTALRTSTARALREAADKLEQQVEMQLAHQLRIAR